jgi:proteasome lid subunit RPN8/RPN11
MVKDPVVIDRSVVKGLLSYAKDQHPKEAILLLRGRFMRGKLVVEEVLIPPLAIHGKGFSGFPLQTLPMDFSIIGTVHSHPSGILNPSPEDLNRFYGRIMLIVAYPYDSERDVAIFDGKGRPIKYDVVDLENVS